MNFMYLLTHQVLLQTPFDILKPHLAISTELLTTSKKMKNQQKQNNYQGGLDGPMPCITTTCRFHKCPHQFSIVLL